MLRFLALGLVACLSTWGNAIEINSVVIHVDDTREPVVESRVYSLAGYESSLRIEHTGAGEFDLEFVLAKGEHRSPAFGLSFGSVDGWIRLDFENRGIEAIDGQSLHALGDFNPFFQPGGWSLNQLFVLPTGNYVLGTQLATECSDPAPTCPDAGRYSLSASVSEIAAPMPGDSDADGSVDFADFLRLAANFGRDAHWAKGDFDGDHTVTMGDFLVLRENYGSRAVKVAAVPEPQHSVTWMLGLLWFGLRGVTDVARSPAFRRMDDGAALPAEIGLEAEKGVRTSPDTFPCPRG